ncbi:hypothetical protein GCM10025881_17660 [Pseudolysinimonas kribbensis]|uniref:Uncharacterized protein n=1 Tax=Pseudolysinimonas kribbensis TaxID=433641 RepID=A0ABQ6K4P0_9MICO|nr:hypothetical protein [Pseudolysinimonas kribbensis]GMA94942.1 hypothetical protein GCM10025881_17660 [Pseudolysinimonas kribbensis]
MSKSPSVRAGRVFDARLQLLDRQVLDPDGMPVTAVAGLELSDVPWGEDLPADAEAPVVTALLTGPVLGTRVFGGRLPRRDGSGSRGATSGRSARPSRSRDQPTRTR